MDDAGLNGGVEITLSVKFGGQNLSVPIGSGVSVKDLMLRLQQLTNVPPRGQKLIFKGKVLDPEMTLAAAKLTNGSKLMLMASEGVHQGANASVLQGSPPSTKSAKSTLQNKFKTVLSSLHVPKVQKPVQKGRVANWQATGIVSLRESRIQTIPKEVWTLGTSVRILDLSSNSVKAIPPEIASLSNLQRLNLSNNVLSDASTTWTSLCSLKALNILALDHNKLSVLPAEVGKLTFLKQLNVSHNQIKVLPEELGNCAQLEKLDCRHNQIKEIPGTLSNCKDLSEVDLSGNFITSVPTSLSQLQYLKVMNLDNNALTSFPGEILSGCSELITLSVHGNQITIEQLRETEGWPEFDRRRKSKYTKQLEFNVIGSSGGFDEGADPERVSHW